MTKEYIEAHIEALEAILRRAADVPLTEAHWRTVEAVAKLIALAKQGEPTNA